MTILIIINNIFMFVTITTDACECKEKKRGIFRVLMATDEAPWQNQGSAVQWKGWRANQQNMGPGKQVMDGKTVRQSVHGYRLLATIYLLLVLRSFSSSTAVSMSPIRSWAFTAW
ncbi:MAG: hypothetical protein OEW15_17435 [Nitrospirota bacterium]|nr:hypothetical protein [Nitrospirota bacterium]